MASSTPPVSATELDEPRGAEQAASARRESGRRCARDFIPRSVTAGRLGAPAAEFEIDPAARADRDALAPQAPDLLAARGAADAHVPAGAQHAPPGDPRVLAQSAQRSAREPRAPGESGLARDLPVRRDAAARDRVHGREDALARV